MPRLVIAVLCGVLAFSSAAQDTKSDSTKKSAGPSKSAMISEALSAAPAAVAKTAKVMDWDGHVLREGSSAYTCFPTPPQMRKMGKEPMCLDATWQKWAQAWFEHKDFKADQAGIAYMLGGDVGASNTDPYATEKKPDNQWVVSGPHMMVLVPDASALANISTDPNNGGPFVMWKGTPYAHIMVPIGAAPKMAGAKPAGEKPKNQ
jgi:hypothetical protein